MIKSKIHFPFLFFIFYLLPFIFKKSPFILKKLPFTFYLLSFILIVSCTTSPQSGSLSGNICLEGEVDHSGITVALYDLAELDQDIVDINEEYPFIGVKISQTTEFDHRFATLTKYTETDANGNFKIKDIPTGRYNMVAMKDSFGFRYIYEVSINEGDNALEEQSKKEKGKNKKVNIEENDSFNLSPFTFNLNKSEADIILYPETHISSDIDTTTTWHSSHHYIIEDDIYISGDLTIEPGAVIRLNEGVKLTISGDLTAIGEEENMIWFTSNDLSRRIRQPAEKTDSLISLYPYIPYTFNRVELIGSLNKQVSFCKFTQAGTGLLNKVNGFSISDCIFRNSACGFKSEGVDSTFCSNLLCENITGGSGGIYFSSYIDGGNIKNNVCSNCVSGIKIYNHSNPEVKNNYINNCNTGIDISYSSSPEVHNNEIYGLGIGVHVLENSCPKIEKQVIRTNFGIVSEKYYIPIEIHYNNFNCSQYVIKIIPHGGGYGVDINAENNYFGTIEENEIQNLIYDKNDVDESQQQYYGIVDFEPFLTQEYPYAGISK